MSLMNYIAKAFNARPFGMPLPPNWAGLAAFGLLGLENPGFWVLGAGLELAYLLALSTNHRFQRLIDGQSLTLNQQSEGQRLAALLARLSTADQARYRALEDRCKSVLQSQKESHTDSDPPPLGTLPQTEGFERLLYVYLRLLLTKSTIARALDDASSKSIDLRIRDVSTQLKNATSPQLHHSLADQLAILAERKKRQAEARDKLTFIEAELVRIQEQVELIRESLLVNADPQTLSTRIDSIAETLNSTSSWIKEQQQFYGQTEDLLASPPPISLTPERETQ
jgi:hypothetical protein